VSGPPKALDAKDGGAIGLQAAFDRGRLGGLEILEGGGEVIAGESDLLLPFAVDDFLWVQPCVVAQDEAGVIADIEDRAVIILDLMPPSASRRVGEMFRAVRHGCIIGAMP
jgi:hypothetical protein